MKLAYLITAYDQPKFLGRLISALDYPGAFFFIHIDLRVNISPFLEAVGEKRNVFFVPGRKKINWMGFSQIESILELIKFARNFNCDYYNLLSGSDYPIKSNEFIFEFFSKTDLEFLTFWRLEDRPSWFHKVQLWYTIDWVPILNYQNAKFRRYYWGYFYKVSLFIPKRRFPQGFIPYGGSDWWSLSIKAITLILNTVNNNPKLVSFFRYTQCPSELFFHTIILNSELAAKVNNYRQYNEWRETLANGCEATDSPMLPEEDFNLRYIDWSFSRTGGLGRPAVLDTSDFEALKNSKCLFARKFDEILSSGLADRVDNLRCQVV